MGQAGEIVVESRPAEYGAWNPGLESELPREYLPLATIFRPENVSTGIAKAYELSDYCGLPVHELVAFRADRLIVHELLIHVITGISVPDGRDYEDLGRNFREIAATILNRYIAPHRAELAQVFEQLEKRSFRQDRAGACKGVRRAETGGRSRAKKPMAPAIRHSHANQTADCADRDCRGARPTDCFRMAEKIADRPQPVG